MIVPIANRRTRLLTAVVNDSTITDEGGIVFNPDGNCRTGSTDLLYAWLTAGTAADFEIMAHRNSGYSGSLGTALDVWFPLSTARSWAVPAPASLPSRSVNLTVSIRRLDTGAVLDTGTVVITENPS